MKKLVAFIEAWTLMKFYTNIYRIHLNEETNSKMLKLVFEKKWWIFICLLKF